MRIKYVWIFLLCEQTRHLLWGQAPLAPPKEENILISADALFSAGLASADDEGLKSLQAEGHDSKNRGFNLQGVELSLLGHVDPFFFAEIHTLFSVDSQTGQGFVELEEAYAATQSLPMGLSIKGGLFLTDFGRLNKTHPHAWQWLDQPVISSRILGSHGVSGLGIQAAMLIPTSFYWQLSGSIQNAYGENMASFGGTEETIPALRPFTSRKINGLESMVYSLRNEWGGDFSDKSSWLWGTSLLTGPNSLGVGTFTQIYGTDFTLKWRPQTTDHGWPFVMFQSEAMLRTYHVDPFTYDIDPNETLDDTYVAGGTLDDVGLYSQLLIGFARRWSVGMRIDMATANEDAGGFREFDPRRNDRVRVSPLIVFQPSEYARLRVQYNLDRAQHLEQLYAHSFWIGMEFMYGKHPAHTY